MKKFNEHNLNEPEERIARYTKFREQMKKRKRVDSKIKLGDYITIGKFDNKDKITGKFSYYRCVGINPKVVLQGENSDIKRTLTDEEYENAYQNSLTDAGEDSPYWTIEI